MKVKLYTAVSLIILLILVKGCISNRGIGLTDSDQLVIIQENLPPHLDPVRSSSYENVLPLTGIYEGLVKLNPETLSPEPCLAESWKVSGEGKRLTFYLKPGIRFGDGTECNANAVKASMIRSMALKDEEPYASFVFSPVESIETEGNNTITFNLKYPFAPFLKNLALPFAAPLVSPTAFGKYGEDFWEHPSGTGPYMVSQYKKNKIVLQANPYFRGEPAPLKKILFIEEKDPLERTKKLLSKKGDIIFYPGGKNVEKLRMDGMKIVSVPGLDISYLGFYTDKPPFNNRLLRSAVAGVLDREKIVSEVLEGEAIPALSILPPALSTHKSNLTRYTPDHVRNTLNRLGYPGGIDITLITYKDSRRYSITGGKVLAEEIKKQLEPAGIRIKIIEKSWDEHKSAIQNREGDLFLFGWTGDNSDPDNFMYTLFSSTQVNQGLNTSRFKDPKLDVYLVTARRVTDPKARQLLYKEAESIIMSQMPVVPLSHSIIRIAALPEVQGIYSSGFGLIDLYSIKKSQQ
ncbi:MAG: ABC transporter substrate-binding protein [Bacillota bacterium]